MGLWSCCWRDWNIFNLARNQKKDGKKEKNMEAHISSSKHMRSPQTNSTSLFYSGIFLQLLLTVYFYLTSYLSAWQPGQHRLVWKKKNKQGGCSSFWNRFHHVDIFSATWLWFMRKSFQWTGPNVCKQRCTSRVIYFRFAVEKQTEVYSRDPVCLAKHSLSCTTQNSSTFLLFFSPQSCVLSLSCPRFALFCLESRLSNYQRFACRVVTLDWVISTDCFPWDSAE